MQTSTVLEDAGIAHDGELTHRAYDLCEHGLDMVFAPNERRVVAPKEVFISDKRRSWDSLTPEQKVTYLDGYASASAAVINARGRSDKWQTFALSDRGPKFNMAISDENEFSTRTQLRRQGWGRAVEVEANYDKLTRALKNGDSPRASVRRNVDADTTLMVTNIEEANGFRGKTQAFYGSLAGTVETNQETGESIRRDRRSSPVGEQVRFDKDSIVSVEID